MQMEKERLNGNGNIDYDYYGSSNGVNRVVSNREGSSVNGRNPAKLLPVSSLPGIGYIEHPVSKFDTLAGVAIKYGVEVADIKRMNGLVTDIQMFALKTLQIPLPGRHPLSPCLSNDSNIQGHCNPEQTPTRVPCDLFKSFPLRADSSQRKVSSNMNSLQGYYGLNKPTDQETTSLGCEMAVYRKGSSLFPEDGSMHGSSPLSNPHFSHQQKSKSTNGFLDDTASSSVAGESDSDKWSDKLVRRRQKSVADFSRTPQMLLKDDNSNNGWFSSITGKGLALRPKAASKTALASDAEAGGLTPIPIGLGDSFVVDGVFGVRKSSSTPTFQEQENSSSSSSIWSSSSSIWSTSRWTLKPDLQALSTVSIARPIFDLPKPMAGRRNKPALD